MKSPSTLAPEILDRWDGVIPIKPLLTQAREGWGGWWWWYLKNGRETISEAPRNDRISRKLKTFISKMVFIACYTFVTFELQIFNHLSQFQSL